MKEPTEMGTNRTGIEASPLDERLSVERATFRPPSSPGGGKALADLFACYVKEAEPIGTMPPPASLKQAGNAVVQAALGKSENVLLDKLGERCAFERTGTRLYEALIAKHDALGAEAGGPMREELCQIRDDELAHFLMLCETIRRHGGDPTAVTPSADLSGVLGHGVIEVVNDPRTTLAQSLEAILVAELVDNECWASLGELVSKLGDEEAVRDFESARFDEERHLASVRRWVASSLGARAETKKAA